MLQGEIDFGWVIDFKVFERMDEESYFGFRDKACMQQPNLETFFDENSGMLEKIRG